MKCINCGQELGEEVKCCPVCKSKQSKIIQENNLSKDEKYPYSPRSRVTAGLLQIFLGGFGLGRFYLGYNGIALAQLFTTPVFFIGAIWGFIDGILILCGQVDCDVNGIPVK